MRPVLKLLLGPHLYRSRIFWAALLVLNGTSGAMFRLKVDHDVSGFEKNPPEPWLGSAESRPLRTRGPRRMFLMGGDR